MTLVHEAFKRWAGHRGFDQACDEDGHYEHEATAAAWEAWQAASAYAHEVEAYLVTFRETRRGSVRCVTMASLEPSAPVILDDERGVTQRELLHCLPLIVGFPAAERQAGLVAFSRLPLGARFHYQGSERTWVVLAKHGAGLVAECSDGALDFIGQQICSAADSAEELATLMVFEAQVPVPGTAKRN